jgi:hypothetical protein
MRVAAALFLVMIVLSFASPIADAHFKLLAPQSWIAENNLGDPQKLGPCGGTSADGGMPTNFINKIQGGQKLHLKLQETVYHPGHYRVSLAVNSRAELPDDPQVVTRDSARGLQSVSAAIDRQPKMPVLADGLFPHTERMNDPWETDIEIPNINCPKCTLQIVQFMAEHGLNKDGGYFYHHCADLQITADPAKPIDKRWPAAR